MAISRTNPVYRFQGFVLDVSKRKLTNSGRVVKLGSRAFDTLVELVQHRGDIVTKDHLMKTIWSDIIVEDNNISQAIGTIRRALNDSSSKSIFIQTIPGRGYCFIAELGKEKTINQSPTASNADALPLPDTSTSIFIEIASHQYFKTSAIFLGLLLLACLFFFPTRDINTEVIQTALAPSQAINSSMLEVSSIIIPDSIAVMPFTNMNKDDASELFALSLHDELINQLGKVDSVKIIARNSIMSLYKEGRSISEIAELLNIESLIEGTILILGEHARINLQMVDATTGVD